ncbi:hypothetical protein IWT140_00099 [Secundilactobacillus pentosiphilus]|uniref:Uncharacterized protein n=1 Tax=Secundilactobacillus pentosiphilus TaxID=1714682 RepID=A0A1Z5ILP3_9LACO|nr:hypothetical protein [Secundilactobacillus pentosiphilus]GAX02502.1 hypothetical protein IWT140_00099 [Secundilactobacillus pentosiphilus]GAX06413.1 hypothetical protein IWT25_01757 [Secundilactobacillus pentosiphilus]
MQENANSNIEDLVGLTPVKVLSQNMNKVAQGIESAADAGEKHQVLQLVDSAESLLDAISKLNS